MTNTSDDIFNDEVLPPQRPTFLTVLCILTFIGSGYGLINGAITYFNAESISKVVVNVKVKTADDINRNGKIKDTANAAFRSKVMNSMSVISTPENLRKTALGNIVVSIICLIGAIIMWRLRRFGFYLYVLGTIIGVIIPFYLFGNNFLAAITSGFASFIGLIFIIFYAMNLKSMKG